MNIWPSYHFLTNKVSVGRGGEDKGRAPTKTHWHPMWGGPNDSVPAGEGRWVFHGCAWPCDICCLFKAWLCLNFVKFRWAGSHKEDLTSKRCWSLQASKWVYTVLYPKLNARNIAEPLLHRWDAILERHDQKKGCWTSTTLIGSEEKRKWVCKWQCMHDLSWPHLYYTMHSFTTSYLNIHYHFFCSNITCRNICLRPTAWW